MGYTHQQTLDSSYVLIESMLQEYAYLCSERNRMIRGEDDGDEDYGEYTWVELPDFATGGTRRYKKYKKLENDK